MGPDELNRLRWQCRRGLLELDVVLERFLEKHGEHLEGERLLAFRKLLALTDDEILELVRARTECQDASLVETVQWIRGCRSGGGSAGSSN